MQQSEALRGTLIFPTWIRYAIAICTTTILPFCYAWSITRKRYLIAAAALIAIAAYYPVSLNKTTLLTPFWLVALTILIRFASWRIAIVLSLLIPMIIGIIAFSLNPDPELIFRIINFRFLAIPASALDHYNHYFSTHTLTGFCQISVIARIFDCGLPDQLGVLMANTYATGNYNASLLATEGVASVGPYLAPLTALACGTVIAAGNVVSSRLDPAFVFLSAATLLQALMNIPLSTVMVTHGGALLFTLWLITPRTIRS
jgi:hypothetical protein